MRAESRRIDDASSLLEGIRASIPDDALWAPYLADLQEDPCHTRAVHLGIFNQPYLDSLLGGKKTVESRFSSVRCAPYRSVRPGDVVLVKRSSGPIVALFRAGDVWSHRLTSKAWGMIRERFAEGLCAAGPGFWQENESAAYATLIEVEHLRHLVPIPWNKSDRRGWVVLRRRRNPNPTLFE